MREPAWKGVFYEVPGGKVRCVRGKRRLGQTGVIRDSTEDDEGNYGYLVLWDNDQRRSWKAEWQLESADPRFPMPAPPPDPACADADGGERG